MHHVLTVQEIIAHIFGFLDQRSNARNACVCKTWSECALDAVWYEVPLPNVFSSLSPMEKRDWTGLVSLHSINSGCFFRC